MIAKYAALFARDWPRCRYDDFYSEGLEGARRAALGWNRERAPYPAYAKPFIVGRMQDHANSLSRCFDLRVQAAHRAVVSDAPTDLEREAEMEDTPEEARQRLVREARAKAAHMAVAWFAAGDAPSAESLAIDREEADKSAAVLREAYAAIAADERRALWLQRVERRTLTEIARELAVSSKTVQRLVERAERRLLAAFRSAGVERAPEAIATVFEE
jgi:RNA polymerase sigma factor (sigma-70 family)